MLPNMDHPEAFGQHPNADITSQIQETRLLFETLLSMQPQTATGTGESREEKVSGGSWLLYEIKRLSIMMMENFLRYQATHEAT